MCVRDLYAYAHTYFPLYKNRCIYATEHSQGPFPSRNAAENEIDHDETATPLDTCGSIPEELMPALLGMNEDRRNARFIPTQVHQL